MPNKPTKPAAQQLPIPAFEDMQDLDPDDNNAPSSVDLTEEAQSNASFTTDPLQEPLQMHDGSGSFEDLDELHFVDPTPTEAPPARGVKTPATTSQASRTTAEIAEPSLPPSLATLQQLKTAITTALPKVLPNQSLTQTFDIAQPGKRAILKDIPVTIETYRDRTLVKVGPCDLSSVRNEKARSQIIESLVTQALQDSGSPATFKTVDVSACVAVKGRYQFGTVKAGDQMMAYVKAKNDEALTAWTPSEKTSRLETASLTALFEHAVRTESPHARSGTSATAYFWKNPTMTNLCKQAMMLPPEDREPYLIKALQQTVAPTTVEQPLSAFKHPSENPVLTQHLQSATQVKALLASELPPMRTHQKIFSDIVYCPPEALPEHLHCQISPGDQRLDIPVTVEDINGKILVKIGPCDLAGAGGVGIRKAIIEHVTNQALEKAGYTKTFAEVNVSACVGVRGFLQQVSPFANKAAPGTHMHAYIKTANDAQLTEWNPRTHGGPAVSTVAATGLATMFEHAVRSDSPAAGSNDKATQAIFKNVGFRHLIASLKNTATESLVRAALAIKNLLTPTHAKTMREALGQLKPEQDASAPSQEQGSTSHRK